MVRRKSVARSISSSSPHLGNKDRRPDVSVFPGSTNRRVRVLKEIRTLRRSVSLLIPRSPFRRMVREILEMFYPTYGVDRIQESALEALQEAVEAYLVQFFEDCAITAIHANRVTVKIPDFILVRYFRGRLDVANK